MRYDGGCLVLCGCVICWSLSMACWSLGITGKSRSGSSIGVVGVSGSGLSTGMVGVSSVICVREIRWLICVGVSNVWWSRTLGSMNVAGVLVLG